MIRSILAVDIGTSSLKAGIIDENGLLVAWAHVPLLLDTNELNAWNADRWVQALAQACKKLQPKGVAGLSGVVISGQGPTLVPVGKDGKAVAPALLWIDKRFDKIPGQPSYFLPYIRSFIQREPETAAHVSCYVPCTEYLASQLGARQVAVIPNQRYSDSYWDDAQCQAYGLPRSIFPESVLPATIIGEVSRTASRQFHLPPGLPIIAGGPDFLVSLLGTSTLEPGDCCDRAGSSEGLNACSPLQLQHEGLRTLPHLLSDFWNVSGIISSSGLLFEWFRRMTGQSKRSHADMLEEVEALGKSSDLPVFIPGFEQGGGFTDGIFWGLNQTHGPVHISRAVVESIGFSVKDALERIRAAGIAVKEIRACGGQAKNPAWCRMKADILGIPLLVPAIEDAELTGDAVLGFYGLGLFPSVEDAAKTLVRFEKRYEPRNDMTHYFNQRASIHAELIQRCVAVNKSR